MEVLRVISCAVQCAPPAQLVRFLIISFLNLVILHHPLKFGQYLQFFFLTKFFHDFNGWLSLYSPDFITFQRAAAMNPFARMRNGGN